MKIILDPLYWALLYVYWTIALLRLIFLSDYRSKERLEPWDTFFTAVDFKCFPCLREIEVKCCEWPINESALFSSNYFAEFVLMGNIQARYSQEPLGAVGRAPAEGQH